MESNNDVCSSSDPHLRCRFSSFSDDSKCSSDIDTDGVIVDICDWQPDTVHMSCQVKYNGNIRPTLSWSKSADVSLVYDSSHGSTLKSNLTVTASSNIEWHKFLCNASIGENISLPIGWPNPKVESLCTYTRFVWKIYWCEWACPLGLRAFIW